MLVKIVTLFLIGMAAVALIGRFRFPRIGRRSARVAPPTICGHCGRYILGKAECSCRKGRG
ncbi:hypothetical protein ORIO_13855 [Cereibacter azotoformans]|uniref:Uncharacterized protein n=1 Tax=Cereibacter azotoformans TaxID=43057 RepID=A0A2T5JV64_9RHOB|nr:hypothetical protein [Cereibacter azotoformans]AXQ94765.1 hypothetical protein D0Z66_13690 [Cereibacter sphaeroides]MBO4170377.1 hypothetical protein [Cereibacter azotoformans]PTR14064.1 hypothetical protein C8J28_11859 [Cereibacter azotoformans]UIJ30332.1 hypothetical protein LV780_13660 [Cereibacter azotoformans]ULB10988.1 hypothetical protein ORIO_13855 [Cereibacter azotoformans]